MTHNISAIGGVYPKKIRSMGLCEREIINQGIELPSNVDGPDGERQKLNM